MVTVFVLLLWGLVCAALATRLARRAANPRPAYIFAPLAALLMVLLPVADEWIALPSYLALCSRSGFKLVMEESAAHGRRIKNQTHTVLRTLVPGTVSVAVVEIQYVDADSGESVIEGIGAVRPWSTLLTRALGSGDSATGAVLLKPCMAIMGVAPGAGGLPESFERLDFHWVP